MNISAHPCIVGIILYFVTHPNQFFLTKSNIISGWHIQNTCSTFLLNFYKSTFSVCCVFNWTCLCHYHKTSSLSLIPSFSVHTYANEKRFNMLQHYQFLSWVEDEFLSCLLIPISPTLCEQCLRRDTKILFPQVHLILVPLSLFLPIIYHLTQIFHS